MFHTYQFTLFRLKVIQWTYNRTKTKERAMQFWGESEQKRRPFQLYFVHAATCQPIEKRRKRKQELISCGRLDRLFILCHISHHQIIIIQQQMIVKEIFSFILQRETSSNTISRFYNFSIGMWVSHAHNAPQRWEEKIYSISFIYFSFYHQHYLLTSN